MEQLKQDQKPKIIEMAKKRRHIHLLEKMQRGKANTPALSKTELKELEQFERDPNSPGIVDSQEKVAKIFGVATRTIERWAKDGMPVTPQGLYDLKDIRAWRQFRKKPQKNAENKQNAWDVRFRKAKAELAELELKKRLGVLVSRETVERELIQISLTIKRALLALPRQVAPQLFGLEPRRIEALLRSRIEEIIQKFSTGNIFAEKQKKTKNAETAESETLE